jgi:hypothetical protein
MNIGCDIDRDTGGVAPSKARLRQRQKCEANAATIQNAFLDLLARRHTRTQKVFSLVDINNGPAFCLGLISTRGGAADECSKRQQHFRYTYVGEENACM